MLGDSDKQVVSYADALAAFKRDSGENAVIASLLRERLNDKLVAPVLDVGATVWAVTPVYRTAPYSGSGRRAA
jgi:hypothetical protein